MDTYILPATVYEPPARQVRHKLNTIMEDESLENEDNGRGRTQVSNCTRSVESSPVPSLTSSDSSYFQGSRRSHDFDDLYDVSDDGSVEDHDITPGRTIKRMTFQQSSQKESYGFTSTRNQYPSIVIPSPSHWPTIQKLQKISPARPPKIPLSPAVLSLFSRDLPNSSQPPSLDGSLASDPLACSTAPTTPDMAAHSEGDRKWGEVGIKQKHSSVVSTDLLLAAKEPEFKIGMEGGESWEDMAAFGFEDGSADYGFGADIGHSLPDSPVLGVGDNYSDAGVQLPPQALDTLRHLSLEIPLKSDFSSETGSTAEMEEVIFESSRRRTVDMTPMSQSSEYSLDQLSIPSPGGFFSSLELNAQQTWCVNQSRAASVVPPSSTTAEQFYNCPWNMDPRATVEQVIEVDEEMTDGPPTARQLPFSTLPKELMDQPVITQPETEFVESVQDYDSEYEQEIQLIAEHSLDRTGDWLAAQLSYTAALRETNPVNDLDADTSKRPSLHSRNASLGSPTKKVVRFQGNETESQEQLDDSKAHQGESIFYHAFQHISNDRDSQDAFRHRQARCDFVQTERACLRHEHVDRLQGNFAISSVDRPAPQRPISMFPGKEGENESASEQKVINRVEKERQALDQINTSTWVTEASRFLNGGKLLNSPAVKELAFNAEHMHVLDLGGLPNCDWAWHCAREYSQAKVYTATTKAQLLNANIRGPSNHRCVAVSKLWELPYPDGHFDGISARSLFTHLKTEKPLSQAIDEYDLCLRECLRCLKPGGYLEFFLLDAELVNAGTLGTAVSVEFSFNLKTRGYDPAPTKNWLGRLRRSGFDDIKRAWTFLPVGAPCVESPALPETPPPDVPAHDQTATEAVRGPVGSTANAAGVAGLVGSWAWEQWMLKLQTEMGRENPLEGIADVMEEG